LLVVTSNWLRWLPPWRCDTGKRCSKFADEQNRFLVPEQGMRI
jgi:hypothetical protein